MEKGGLGDDCWHKGPEWGKASEKPPVGKDQKGVYKAESLTCNFQCVIVSRAM